MWQQHRQLFAWIFQPDDLRVRGCVWAMHGHGWAGKKEKANPNENKKRAPFTAPGQKNKQKKCCGVFPGDPSNKLHKPPPQIFFWGNRENQQGKARQGKASVDGKVGEVCMGNTCWPVVWPVIVTALTPHLTRCRRRYRPRWLAGLPTYVCRRTCSNGTDIMRQTERLEHHGVSSQFRRRPHHGIRSRGQQARLTWFELGVCVPACRVTGPNTAQLL
ncbi:hypothetical protein B0T24DRAFT_405708 [Lasiosphaeria ovina]|uniref:Uncharacterized protein n=1 Tax=Lasiosphaeria ovina TaxID=92902 RepID=A0AAE0N0Q6_9PEZI|nr:hypothetical protein B0T24DRAFT_405708 [Lasiosphaeria ovina]